MSLFVWYFGTKGTRGMWPDVGHHTILNGPRYKDLVDDIFIHGKLAEDNEPLCASAKCYRPDCGARRRRYVLCAEPGAASGSCERGQLGRDGRDVSREGAGDAGRTSCCPVWVSI